MAKRGVGRTSKGQQTQGGTCQLCGQSVTRGNAVAHLVECAPAHEASSGVVHPLIQFRASAAGLPAYWLDLEARADAKLEALDAFLRRVWLECCGHLSLFRIGGADYFSRGYTLGFDGAFGREAGARSMNAKLRDALCLTTEPFEYEYDFGSTTSLALEITGERSGRIGRSVVRLLARNNPPASACAVCRQPATLVCPFCLQEGADPFVCAQHRAEHRCGEEDAFLPVVNSPRMGVCGYIGEGNG